MEDDTKKIIQHKRDIVSDKSIYFSHWKSGRPSITIREEIDDQIAANPTFAGYEIKDNPDGTCEIKTYNDGDVPSPERMAEMNYIGTSYSDKRGASICGVGQLEGLIAGRPCPKSTAILTFRSHYDNQCSEYKCIVDGEKMDIKAYYTEPSPSLKTNYVEKTYEGIKRFEITGKDSEFEKEKVNTAIKVYPYAKQHPEFKYYINNEEIKPFGVLYDGVEDDAIKRLQPKEYTIKYLGKEYTVVAGAIDASRYAKRDGIIQECADPLDKVNNMGPDSCGVFVEVGGVMVITGGQDSWKFIGEKYHSTKNGQRVWIQIPCEGELKEAIFGESQNKSVVSRRLTEISNVSNSGKSVFKELLNDLKCLKNWRNGRSASGANGELIRKEQSEKYYKEAIANDMFIECLTRGFNWLTPEQRNIITTKKFKTILSDINKRNERCYKRAE